MNDSISIYFFILLPLIAFLYASVGHGGASGYLMLMALFSFSPEFMKPTALLLNILVSLIAFLHFYRRENFQWKLFFLLIVASMPMAYLGGGMIVNPRTYKIILGILLVIPALRLIFMQQKSDTTIKEFNPLIVVCIGAGIGYLSGLIGIGGGIILSPFLILLSWTSIKETAPMSALFITVNSIAGLAAQKNVTIISNPSFYLIVSIALAGGLAGAYLGAKKFNTLTFRIILSAVLLLASCKLLITA
ncbi:MAG: sulfite exporter TauE/SafE family protein [Bacteroidetes bacterium]|nr:sulfite exporter TauE/SafE family protein [Bacteroidota bacterium]